MIHSHFVGRLTRNAEVKKVGDNDLCKFSVATDHGYGDKKVALFVECSIWGKRANSLVNYLTKGSQVAVHGELFWRDYEKKDGTKGFTVECRVNEIDLVGGKKSGNEGRSEDAPSYQTAPVIGGGDLDDGIPFARLNDFQH